MTSPDPQPAIRVLVVDDQRAILVGVRALIESEAPRLAVAGLARNGAEAMALAGSTDPRVIVLDVDLGTEDGLDLVPQLRSRCHAAIVVLTSALPAKVRDRAVRLGVNQLVSKAAPGEELLGAILLASERRARPRTDVTGGRGASSQAG